MEDYLALRQQLKQSIRAARLQNNSSGATDSIRGWKDYRRAHNNYRCVFKPSETMFADKAGKETIKLLSKFKIDIDAKKSSATAKPTVDEVIMRKNKVQWLRETRDYSFLSSAEICSAPPIKRDSKRDLIMKEPRKLMEKGVSVEKTLSRAKKELKTVRKQSDQKKEGEGQKRRVEKREREEADYAIGIIRQMFRYDPTRFSDNDKEDLNMEASFADIQKEERRSAKLATKEDREELRKLETQCRKKPKHMN
ncbi:hypothetical protein C2S52_014140 [Perilla frutescens var. hirtella]|nr:hypothetical protein C2S52_014140 [Perilla frutescens var. hirtella]